MSAEQRNNLERLITTIAATIIAAGIIWVAKSIGDLGEQMARIDTRLEPIQMMLQDHEERIRRLEQEGR